MSGHPYSCRFLGGWDTLDEAMDAVREQLEVGNGWESGFSIRCPDGRRLQMRRGHIGEPLVAMIWHDEDEL